MDNEATMMKDTSAEAAVEKPYTLRSLNDGDLFPIVDIVTKVLPEDMSDVFMQIASGEKSLEQLGGIALYKIIVAVLRNISKVRSELYALLSDLSGIPADEIPNMPFGTTPDMIWAVAADAKNANFFKVLSKLQ
jgi:hypothetical protein